MKKMNERIEFKLTEKFKKQIEEYCDYNNVDISEFIRETIKERLFKEGFMEE